MREQELKELKEKVLSVTSSLDAATEDYFKWDNSGEDPETEEIHTKLNCAWDLLDDALDRLTALTKKAEGQEKKITKEQQAAWNNMILHLHELSPKARAELVEVIRSRSPKVAAVFEAHFKTEIFKSMEAAYKAEKALNEYYTGLCGANKT